MDPYPATLYVARTRAMYEAAHRDIFNEEDRLHVNQSGRFSASMPEGARMVFLVWADDHASLVHELAHVALVLFEHVGVEPFSSKGEPFAYLMGNLFRRVARA